MSSLLVQSPFGRQQTKQTQSPPPHVALVSDVVTYLQTRFPEEHQTSYRDQLCQGVYACDPWLVEPILLADLQAALRNDDKDQANRVRGLLRAVSWYERLPVEPERLIAYCDDVLATADTDLVKDCLRQAWKGTEAEQAVQIVERQLLRSYFAYGLKQHDLQRLLDQGYETTTSETQTAQLKRDQALDELHKLRAIRDQLYFQALYKGWYPA